MHVATDADIRTPHALRGQLVSTVTSHDQKNEKVSLIPLKKALDVTMSFRSALSTRSFRKRGIVDRTQSSARKPVRGAGGARLDSIQTA